MTFSVNALLRTAPPPGVGCGRLLAFLLDGISPIDASVSR